MYTLFSMPEVQFDSNTGPKIFLHVLEIMPPLLRLFSLQKTIV